MVKGVFWLRIYSKLYHGLDIYFVLVMQCFNKHRLCTSLDFLVNLVELNFSLTSIFIDLDRALTGRQINRSTVSDFIVTHVPVVLEVFK